MKRTMGLLAVLAVVALTGSFVVAADTATSKPAVMEGKFVKMDEAKLVLKKGDVESTVLTTDATKVTVDGKEAKLADLKEGMSLRITLTDASAPTAAKVVAKSAPVGKAGANVTK